ncbi:MAG: hypothetical protein JSV89_00500 [Spirochaetaceae bacterium]|nr:MAG: hypothetical protein JSV89_00500 [Spirochaetaceae bacterium]
MDRVQKQYIARRRKEDLSFLVIRFLKAHMLFIEIYDEFKALQNGSGDYQHSGLFDKIRNLEQKLVYDIKEKAHFLFRSERPGNDAPEGIGSRFVDLERVLLQSQDAERTRARELFSELRKSLVRKSIDSYIGTGFHLFMILLESVYQLENYVPQYRSELEYLERIEYLTSRIGYQFDEEEEHELDHIRQVVKLCQSIAVDTQDLAAIALERCMALFRETAEILRHSIEESAANEVLVLNLLKEKSLVEQVYGTDSWEAILAHMFRSVGGPEESGRQKAEAFVRSACGNIEGLSDQNL